MGVTDNCECLNTVATGATLLERPDCVQLDTADVVGKTVQFAWEAMVTRVDVMSRELTAVARMQYQSAYKCPRGRHIPGCGRAPSFPLFLKHYFMPEVCAATPSDVAYGCPTHAAVTFLPPIQEPRRHTGTTSVGAVLGGVALAVLGLGALDMLLAL